MKITKKAIKEAPEYMVMIDWKAEKRNDHPYEPFGYKLLNAANIFEAMEEAEDLIDETVYLVKLLQKTGEIDMENGENDSLGIIYKAVMVNRTNGWHTNSYKHGEGRTETTYNPNWGISPISFYKGE